MNTVILNAAANGKLILVLGAGCSANVINTLDRAMPAGRALRDAIADRFGVEIDSEDPEALADVIEAATYNHSKDLVYEFIGNSYTVGKLSDEYIALQRLPIKRIYTLNIDNCLNVLNLNNNRRIDLIQRNDPLKEPDILFKSLQVVKLNGCVTKPENGYIFSLSEYASGHAALPPWYDQLAADCYTNTVVFVGSTVSEPLLFDAIRRTGQSSDQMVSWLITPSLSQARQDSLSRRGIKYIAGTFGHLLKSLDDVGIHKLDPLDVAVKARPELGAIAQLQNIGNLPREDRLKYVNRLQDITPLSGDRGKVKDLKKGIRPFYLGFKPTWDEIRANVPASLNHLEVLKEKIREALASDLKRVVALIGPAGTGKSTAAMMAAHELAADRNQPVLWADSNIDDPLDVISTLEQLYTNGYLLFFPDGPTFSHNIEDALQKNILKHGVVCMPFYQNSWTSKYSENYENEAVETVKFGEISIVDTRSIITQIEKFGPWTRLSKLSANAREQLIHEKSQKQLLVGLIEATQGQGFVEIIHREYNEAVDDKERFALLCIALCTMHRFYFPMVLMNRMLKDIGYDKNLSSFLKSLEGVIRVKDDGLYCRHTVYARTLVEQVADAKSIKSALISLLNSFSVYESPVPRNAPRETGKLFKTLFNHRFIWTMLQRAEHDVLDVYRNFETLYYSDGAYWLQYGLAARDAGQQVEALKLIKRSIDAYDNRAGDFAQHALALQYFILAEITNNDVEVEKYMNTAIEILERLEERRAFDDLYPIATLCMGHLKTLKRLDREEDLRLEAKKYFDRISPLVKDGVGGLKLRELRAELLKVSATNEYEPAFWNRPFWKS